MESLRTGIPTAFLACVLAAGCVDSGLPGENLPLEDARTRPLHYDLYDENAAPAAVHYDGLDWIVAGPALTIADGLLTAVPDAGDGVFALTSDGEHHKRLYLRTTEGLLPLASVPVQGEAPAAGTVEH